MRSMIVAAILALACTASLGLARAEDEAAVRTHTEAAMAADEAAMAEQAQTAPSGHKFCWIEFGSTDTAATAKFFADVFGWGIEDFPAMPGYKFFSPPKGLMGGITPAEGEGQPRTTPYIYVPDIAAALESISAAGGATTFGPEEIPDTGGGKVAGFTDPFGVMYGLADMAMPDSYSPVPLGPAQGPDQQPVAGSIVSLELHAGDFAKAAEFFGTQFTWATQTAQGQYMSFTPGSGVSGVFQNHTPDAPQVAYIWSDDMAATVAKIVAAGGTMLGDAMDVAELGVSMGYFTAPGTGMLGLIAPLR